MAIVTSAWGEGRISNWEFQINSPSFESNKKKRKFNDLLLRHKTTAFTNWTRVLQSDK